MFPVVAQKFFPINPANSLKREAWNLHTITISLINSFLRAISLVLKKYKEGTIRIIRRIIEKSRIDDGILRDLFFIDPSVLRFITIIKIVLIFSIAQRIVEWRISIKPTEIEYEGIYTSTKRVKW